MRKTKINFQLGLLIQPYLREHCPLAEENPNKSDKSQALKIILWFSSFIGHKNDAGNLFKMLMLMV